MVKDFSIAQKLGCEKYALDNCILVKAPVEDVNTIVRQYFALEMRSRCKIVDYV